MKRSARRNMRGIVPNRFFDKKRAMELSPASSSSSRSIESAPNKITCACFWLKRLVFKIATTLIGETNSRLSRVLGRSGCECLLRYHRFSSTGLTQLAGSCTAAAAVQLRRNRFNCVNAKVFLFHLIFGEGVDSCWLFPLLEQCF